MKLRIRLPWNLKLPFFYLVIYEKSITDDVSTIFTVRIHIQPFAVAVEVNIVGSLSASVKHSRV